RQVRLPFPHRALHRYETRSPKGRNPSYGRSGEIRTQTTAVGLLLFALAPPFPWPRSTLAGWSRAQRPRLATAPVDQSPDPQPVLMRPSEPADHSGGLGAFGAHFEVRHGGFRAATLQPPGVPCAPRDQTRADKGPRSPGSKLHAHQSDHGFPPVEAP